MEDCLIGFFHSARMPFERRFYRKKDWHNHFTNLPAVHSSRSNSSLSSKCGIRDGVLMVSLYNIIYHKTSWHNLISFRTLFEKPNDRAQTYQKAHIIVQCTFSLQDKRAAPLKNVSDWQSLSIFTHAFPYAPNSKLSINQHNYHFFLKYYPILVFHN